MPEPTAEEKAAHAHEWGIKYNDECLKFEKEWEVIAAAVEKEQMTYLQSELGDLQQAKCNLLVDKVLELNMFEMRYFQARLS